MGAAKALACWLLGMALLAGLPPSPLAAGESRARNAPETTTVKVFQLASRKGDARSFTFFCNRTGRIRLALQWSGVGKARTCESLYVALRGPRPEGPSAVGSAALRFGREVTTPFETAFDVTKDDLLLGGQWSVAVTSRKGIGTARCTLRIAAPYAKEAARVEREEFNDLAVSRLEFESLGPVKGSAECRVNVKVRVRNRGNVKTPRPFTVVLRAVPSVPGGRGGKLLTRWEVKELDAGAERQLTRVIVLPLGVGSVTFEAEADPIPRAFEERSYGENVMRGTWANPAQRGR